MSEISDKDLSIAAREDTLAGQIIDMYNSLDASQKALLAPRLEKLGVLVASQFKSANAGLRNLQEAFKLILSVEDPLDESNTLELTLTTADIVAAGAVSVADFDVGFLPAGKAVLVRFVRNDGVAFAGTTGLDASLGTNASFDNILADATVQAADAVNQSVTAFAPLTPHADTLVKLRLDTTDATTLDSVTGVDASLSVVISYV